MGCCQSRESMKVQKFKNEDFDCHKNQPTLEVEARMLQITTLEHITDPKAIEIVDYIQDLNEKNE